MSCCTETTSCALPQRPATLQRVTLAVLAGGEGSRMGMPKGLLQIHEEPILRHLLRRAAWPGPTLLVTAPGREHPPAWEEYDLEVPDPVADCGPLRGILTALEAAQTECVLVSTVDMPAVSHAQFAWLAAQAQDRPDAMGLMLRREAGEAPCIEPFPAIFRRDAASLLRERLAAAQRSVSRLTSDPRVALVNAPAAWSDAIWANLNHPADLQTYLQCLDRECSRMQPLSTPELLSSLAKSPCCPICQWALQAQSRFHTLFDQRRGATP
jgi:molybdenum cofactor guanylyltransferase